MDATGQIWLDAAPQRVWESMLDPEVLSACVPGCQAVRREGAHDYRFELDGTWGPLRARFDVQVLLHDLEHFDAAYPGRYRLTARGTGSLGFAEGSSLVRLEPREAGTLLHYEADGLPDGRLARLGRPVLRRAARHLSDKFFRRFAATVSAGAG
jgi:carbon monoxide dehydrogenase subunit G